MKLEAAIRNYARLDKLNLFRNKTRGGFEAAVSRGGSTFSVGIDDDPVRAILIAFGVEKPNPEPPASTGVFD